MKPKIVLIGGGGHCLACIDVIEQEKKFEIAGIIDKVEKKGSDLLGYPYMGTDDEIPELCGQSLLFLITVGQITSSRIRFELFNKIQKHDGEFPCIVSPLAYLSSHSGIGKGTIVMHNALINSAVEIGENCIVNTGAIVEHDVRTGSHIHISTGAVVNGGVHIGNHTFIGSCAMIREGVNIGENVIIGAGARVFKNVPDETVVKGLYR